MELPETVKNVELCGLYLAKTMCVETNATTASLELDMTHEGKPIGKYKITIEKV